MEKLIELLNEYENRDLELEEGEESNARTENNGHLRFNGANKVQFDTYMFDSLALSKKYGFIKWLVGKDKINIKALVVKGEMRSGWDFDNKKGNEESGEEIWNKYFSELCLMILAIQDEPINFLISILKNVEKSD